jgi:flagellum-specific ATP synthase
MNDPVADAVRSILDGHVVLDRRLATSGHFPCIDVLESVSRANRSLTDAHQRESASTLRQLLAARRDAKDLVEIGAYVAGTNPLVDRALAQAGDIDRFLRQDLDHVADLAESWSGLHALAGAR